MYSRCIHMKEIERSKAQKVVDKIQSGTFDENDVDNLFMRLRAYSCGQDVFREFADFVAHNDERDRGIINSSLDAFRLSIKYFIEYASPKKALDISRPFPLYVKRLMKYQVDKSSEAVLREKFSVTRARLKSRIDSLFAEDKKGNTAYLRKGKIGTATIEALQHVLGFIGSHPVITQEALLEQLVVVLRKNHLQFDEGAIAREAPKISLSALLLLHDARFEFHGQKPGYCRISCDNVAIPHNTRFVDENGREVDYKDEFGVLQVLGYVVLDKDGKDLTICFPVMSTSLNVDDWCDQSLFRVGPPTDHANGHLFKVINLGSALCLGSDFKLRKVGG